MPNRRRIFLSLTLLAAGPALAQQRPPSLADASRFQLLEPLPLPQLQRSRRLRVYLPPSYAKQGERRYPVIYFHDGQNVFDDATSYAGEWGADELLDQLAATQGLEAIAVGIDNGAELRMRELNPWDHERFGKGEGFAYLRDLVETIKPLIDRQFRSRPEAASTALIGSSMGGLITHTALHRHREVFGLGGVLSPSFWIAPQAYALADAEPLLPTQRLFVFAGGREGPDTVANARRMFDLQRRQGAQLKFVEEPSAQHNEAAWRAVLPQVLAHLFQPTAA